MNELEKRLANLSPEKRALLMQQLAKNAAKDKSQSEIGRRPRPERMPLSSAQQRLWILDRFEPGNTVYNVSSLLRLIGPLDIEVMSRTLSEIVRRHETLRTVFVSDDEGPYQRILPAEPLKILQHDVADRPESERVPAAMGLARDDAATSFDLVNGPILRVTLIRIGVDDHLLVLCAHHIAVDGWSFGVLATELTELYGAYLAGRPSTLPELPIQYADYTLWQRDEMEGEGHRKQLEYWKTQFETLPPVLELPGDRPRPAKQSYRGSLYRHVIPADVFEPIKRLARQEGTTAFMVFLAAVQVLLSRYSGQDDVTIGVGNANRPRRELEALIGFFVNTLPLRGDLSGNPTFRELLAQVKQRTIDSYANQDMPFERLLECLDIERSLSHTPLFQTMVFFQNFPEQYVDLSGLKILPVNLEGVHSGTSRTDLTFFANETGGALLLLMEYASDLFDVEYIRDLTVHLQQLLVSIVEDPGKRIAALEIMPSDQRKRVLEEWNATAQPLPAETTLHAMFAAQAARTPQAEAVVQYDAAGVAHRLSYAELDVQAEAIAAQLRARGCGPGTMVGLFLHRKPQMLAAMLGAWKAGAAYVPLDPSYPAERIAWMIEDSAMPVVLADAELIAELPSGPHAVLSIDDALSPSASRIARDEVGAGRRRYRLRYFHLRFDRSAQGRLRPASCGSEFSRIDGARAWFAGWRYAMRDHDVVVRYRLARTDAAAVRGRTHRLGRSRHRSRWRSARCVARSRRGHRDAGDAVDVAHAARIGLARPAADADVLRRRRLTARTRRSTAAQRPRAVESLWPDRNHGVVDGRSHRSGRGRDQYRQADRQHRNLHRRPAHAAATAGNPW